MTPASTTSPGTPPQKSLIGQMGLHFWVAAVILASSWAGWDATCRRLHLAMIKEPVPWPTGVVVDTTNFRMVSFPTQLGPFEQLKTTDASGQSLGEEILKDDILETLKIGTREDKNKVQRRSSNWYLSRIYRDTRKGEQDPYSLWRLQLYYYTGAVDKVPHVPERCGVAAGATLIGNLSHDVLVSSFTAKDPWNAAKGLNFRRAVFEVPDEQRLFHRQQVEYYLFSLNGRPETDWKTVRGKLSMSWDTKYCYFAKIQFSPLYSIGDLAEADRKSSEFASYFMPSIIQTLPMPEDVEKLNLQK